MYSTIFYVIILIILADYIFERWLAYLNSKSRGTDLPAELKGIYDQDKLQKAINYDTVSSKFGNIASLFMC